MPFSEGATLKWYEKWSKIDDSVVGSQGGMSTSCRNTLTDNAVAAVTQNPATPARKTA